MPFDFTKRIVKGELVFPDFAEGSFLSVDTNGKVIPLAPTVAPTLQSATFNQPVVSSLWQFTHTFGIIPFVITVYDLQGNDITDAVNVIATTTTVEIRTDNSPVAGKVVIYSFVSGSGGSGGSGETIGSDVALLMHFNGFTGDTNFVDEKGHTVTPVGEPVISTFFSQFNNSCLYLDGSSYLVITKDASLTFAANPFQFEAWIRLPDVSDPSTANNMVIMGNALGTAGGNGGCFLGIHQGKLIFRHWIDDNSNASSIANVIPGDMHHVAVTKVGTVTNVFLDGIKGNAGTIESSISDNNFIIGAVPNNGGSATNFTGYIDETLVRNDRVVYTADFTPATAPFASDGTISTNYFLANDLKGIIGWGQLLVSDLAVFSSSNINNEIESWTDQSGNNISATNTANYPTAKLDPTLQNKQVLSFTGSQFLIHSPVVATEKTIFILAKYTHALSDSYLLGNSAGATIIFGYEGGTSNPRLFAGNSNYFSSSPYSSVLNQWTIFELTIDSDLKANLYLNGVKDTTTITLSSEFNHTRISGFSSGRVFDGDMAMVGQISSIPSAIIRQSIRQKIADWAGITI